MMKHRLICITCPMGCQLTATRNHADDPWTITGNRCPRGVEYARHELSDPRRVVTAVVRSDSAEQPYLPVRTDQALPRPLIDALLNRLYRMQVKIPVKCGDILLADVEKTGVRVIFSCDCDR